MLVQAYKYFNIINLIYPNEDKGKCLCIGDKTINGSSVFLNRRRESFSDDMLVYKDYFVVLSQIDGKSNLLFIDYNGNPLKKVELDSIADSFDIDFYGNKIYTYNSETTVFNVYSL